MSVDHLEKDLNTGNWSNRTKKWSDVCVRISKYLSEFINIEYGVDFKIKPRGHYIS